MKGFFGSHPSQDLNFRLLVFLSFLLCESWVGVNGEKVTLGLRAAVRDMVFGFTFLLLIMACEKLMGNFSQTFSTFRFHFSVLSLLF